MPFDTSIYSKDFRGTRPPVTFKTEKELHDEDVVRRDNLLTLAKSKRAERSAHAQEMSEETIRGLYQKYTTKTVDGTSGFNEKGFLQELYTIDPLAAQKMEAESQSKSTSAMGLTEKQLGIGKKLLDSIHDEPSYQYAREQGIRLGLPGADKIPETYDPAFVESRKVAALSFDEQRQLRQEASQDAARTQQEKVFKETVSEHERAATRDARDTAYGLEEKFSKDYTDGTKSFSEVRSAYGRVKAAHTSLLTGGKGISDVALINGFMRMIDPGGVVRPSDIENIMMAKGVPERIAVRLQNWQQGDVLSPEARAELVGTAELLYANAEADAVVLMADLQKRALLYPEVRPEAIGPGVGTSLLVAKKGGQTFTPLDVVHTAELHGIPVAEVIKRIREAGGGVR